MTPLLEGNTPYLVVGLLLVAWSIVERVAMSCGAGTDEDGGQR